jgi:hypothetical protein
MALALSQEILDHLLGPVSIVVATRDARMRPAFTRVLGIVAGADGVITLFAPVVTSDVMLANLRANGAIAVQIASWANFHSYQIKGTFLDAAPAGPEADAVMDATRRKAVEVTSKILGEKFGAGWGRFVARPTLRIDFRAEEVFLQTPGPNAGARIET